MFELLFFAIVVIIACIIVLFIIKRNKDSINVPSTTVSFISPQSLSLPATAFTFVAPKTGTYFVVFGATYQSPVVQTVNTSISVDDTVQPGSTRSLGTLVNIPTSVTLQDVIRLEAGSNLLVVVSSSAADITMLAANFSALQVSDSA